MKYSTHEPEEGSAEYNAALEEYKKVAHTLAQPPVLVIIFCARMS